MLPALNIRRFFSSILLRPTVWQMLAFYGTSMLAAAVNYGFNMIMARGSYLGPAAFGELAALSSFIYIDGVIVTTLATATAYHVSALIGQNKQHEVGPLLGGISKRVGFPAILVAAILVIASPWVASFLQLSAATPVIWLAPILLISLLLGIMSGALQGVLSLVALSLVGLSGALLRLVFGVGFVLIGFGVDGVLAGTLGAGLLTYVFAWLLLRRDGWLKVGEFFRPGGQVWTGALLIYGGPVMVATLGLTGLYSLDVILAKHWLSPIEAGLYGGLSVLGRVVYFLTLPITLAMFPVLTRRIAQGLPIRSIVLLSGMIMAAIAGGIFVIYAIMPATVLRLTIGPDYLPAAPYLWLVALLFVAVSWATWLTHILLAMKQIWLVTLPAIAVLLQFIMIFLWHDFLWQIATGSVVASAGLALALSLSLWRPPMIIKQVWKSRLVQTNH